MLVPVVKPGDSLIPFSGHELVDVRFWFIGVNAIVSATSVVTGERVFAWAGNVVLLEKVDYSQLKRSDFVLVGAR